MVVKADGATAIDLADNDRVLWRKVDSPLVAIRQTLVIHRGSVGKWFITDDHRYVVVCPSPEIALGGSAALFSNDPMPVNIFGHDIDLQHQAIIYDTQSQRISAAGAQLSQANPGWDEPRLLGVNSSLDGLELLYQSAITDAQGVILHSIPNTVKERSPNGGSSFGSTINAGFAWDAKGGHLVRIVITKCGSYPGKDRPTGPTYAIEIVSYATQKLTTISLDWSAIRNLVDSAAVSSMPSASASPSSNLH